MILSERRNGALVQTPARPMFTERCDVLVAGLGTAGAVAALRAAELGLSVTGVEKFPSMGGMMTNGGVGGYYFGGTGGYFETIDRRGAYQEEYSGPDPFSVDSHKRTLDEMARENGVRTLFDAVVTGVYLEGKQVVGVRVFYQDTNIDMECGTVIDATGDCVVCYMAGCETQFGRASDEVTLPFTSVRVYLSGHKEKRTNSDCGIMDQRDPERLTRGLIRAHASHLSEDYGGEDVFLGFCPWIGIREGRRIIGEEQVTLEQYFEGTWSKEPVFYAYADIDKHGTDTAFESRLFKDWYVCSNMGAANLTVPVPKGALIPRGYDGILAAGRCLSVDHDLSTCVRMNRDMRKTGEIAADMTYLAQKGGAALKAVDYSLLKEMLEETGCLEQGADRRIRLDGGTIPTPIPVDLSDNEKRVKRELSSKKPAWAIWTCRKYREKYRPILEGYLNSGQENLSRHSAIALGVAGSYAGRALIREMVHLRDGAVLEDMRKHNQIRGVIAICLGGKFGDAGLVEELLTITAPQERERALYRTHAQRTPKFNNVYFQFLSHSVASLLEIVRAHPELRTQVVEQLCENLRTEAYIRFITEEEPGSSEYEMARNLRLMAEKASVLYH